MTRLEVTHKKKKGCYVLEFEIGEKKTPFRPYMKKKAS